MERILIYIKHHFGFLWKLIESFNGLAFSFLYRSRVNRVLPHVIREVNRSDYSYRKLYKEDAEELYQLIHSQEFKDLEFFSPHRFDQNSILKQFSNPAFLMMGAFEKDQLVGYFFLRFFVNRRCFVGRLIDKEYRGKGIGGNMNSVMYEIAWRSKFRCLSTISKNNIAVIRAHAKNSAMILLKELDNDYLLVEFVNKKP